LLLNRLTRREREVLLLIGAGMSNKAMAEDLRVSVTTVRAHVQSVLQKLSVHSKLEAMAKAQELDISS
jgi:DNA-binding NarL/FixJ family response regulator